MRKLIITAYLGVVMALSGCGAGKGVDQYKGEGPALTLEQYFNGPVKAWGILQDRSGKVTRRFDIDMVGEWQGDEGTLTEKFSFYDGEIQERVWKIKRLADGSYEGRAGDILDKATGRIEGNAAQWRYVMDLPVDDTTYRITFDDWMFLMNDGVLVNRSYLKKFGFRVAELTIFMQKQTP